MENITNEILEYFTSKIGENIYIDIGDVKNIKVMLKSFYPESYSHREVCYGVYSNINISIAVSFSSLVLNNIDNKFFHINNLYFVVENKRIPFYMSFCNRQIDKMLIDLSGKVKFPFEYIEIKEDVENKVFNRFEFIDLFD